MTFHIGAVAIAPSPLFSLNSLYTRAIAIDPLLLPGARTEPLTEVLIQNTGRRSLGGEAPLRKDANFFRLLDF